MKEDYVIIAASHVTKFVKGSSDVKKLASVCGILTALLLKPGENGQV